MKIVLALLCALFLCSPVMAAEPFTANDFVQATQDQELELTNPITTEVNIQVNKDGTCTITQEDKTLSQEEIKQIETKLNTAGFSKLANLKLKLKAIIVKTGNKIKVTAIKAGKGLRKVCIAILPVVQVLATIPGVIILLLFFL